MRKIICLFLCLCVLPLCGCEKAVPADWRTKDTYSCDYPIGSTAVFCVKLNADKTAYEVYDTADGSLAGTLDFAAHSAAGLYYGEDLDCLDLFDHDGDGRQEFGVTMDDGRTLWYRYTFAERGNDRFRFLESEEVELDFPSETSSEASGQ